MTKIIPKIGSVRRWLKNHYSQAREGGLCIYPLFTSNGFSRLKQHTVKQVYSVFCVIVQNKSCTFSGFIANTNLQAHTLHTEHYTTWHVTWRMMNC